MKTITVDTDWKYKELKTISIENKMLRLIILPELGAKIFRLIHKPTDTNLLWENPRLTARQVPIGTCYDDNFVGGWDESFPNDVPITLNDEMYPDHGDLWCQPWHYAIDESSENQVIVHLWCFSSVTNVRVDKWLTMSANSQVIHFRHRIQNMGNTPIDFLWKLHPALNISPSHRIDLPGCRVWRADEAWSDVIAEDDFTWPTFQAKNGQTLDLRNILAYKKTFKEFVYAVELEDGWCALTDTESRVGFGIRFPREVFPCVWLFLTCGGWRGYHTLIIEPCTAYPVDLAKAIAQGTCSHLEPQKTLECEVEAVVYEGLQSVRKIHSGGEVLGD